MRRFLVAAAAACVVTAGCASNELGSFEDEPLVREIEAKGLSPMELRVALAPIEIAYEPTAQGEGAEGWSVEMDRNAIAAVQAELEEALGREGLFRDLLVLADEAGVDPFQAAWDAGADLLIEVRITRYRASYVETTGWYVPNLFIWGYAWIPSWWVADERYGSEVEAVVTLRSVHTGEVVWEKTYEPSVARDLDDWERGWIFAGILRVPGALEEENWEKIDRVVGPFAMRKVILDLYADLHGEFREYQKGTVFTKQMTKTLALVVGVTKYRYRKIRNIGYADRDAEAIGAVLRDPRIGGLIPQNVMTLVDEQATLDGIREAVEGFLQRRATSLDSVILYYAGNGSSWGGQPYILPWDFDPDDPDRTALGIATLGEWIEGISCRNLITILDCSFNGASDGRCFPLPGLTGEAVAERTIEVLADKPHRWVFLGALPDQSANEQDSVQNGIFSYYLVEALRGDADADRDGVVLVSEAFEFLKDRVDRQSQLKTGRDQNPNLIPGPADPVGGAPKFPITSPAPGEE